MEQNLTNLLLKSSNQGNNRYGECPDSEKLLTKLTQSSGDVSLDNMEPVQWIAEEDKMISTVKNLFTESEEKKEMSIEDKSHQDIGEHLNLGHKMNDS